ncbi:outer membrane protein assembly factor BamE [Falsiroseomonas tokyonensis]|uniref:Outer membrane protein assembly factor BamE n=1 Tax=Falsiroseomonas tokyonensis TaxID=430521 RepID=A0ABV7C015_9PROT|nr:outer membrane protein assembly factor BamE [Falsiroseomonas tokyonensis]MBU8540250.1 outer membrane protein assembly factor BamE [Falsiroseomonas tokyonensis]
MHAVNILRPSAARRTTRLGLALGALLATAGCSWMPSVPGASLFESPRQMRGHAVDEEALAQITPGVSSRADVEAVIGSPSHTGTFDNSTWYYMSSVTRQRPARTLSVEDQRVVAISFNQAGVVQDIKRYGPEDAREVEVVTRITPAPGNDRTLLQQLFGNIGRLAPGLGGQTNQTIGAPTR